MQVTKKLMFTNIYTHVYPWIAQLKFVGYLVHY